MRTQVVALWGHRDPGGNEMREPGRTPHSGLYAVPQLPRATVICTWLSLLGRPAGIERRHVRKDDLGCVCVKI